MDCSMLGFPKRSVPNGRLSCHVVVFVQLLSQSDSFWLPFTISWSFLTLMSIESMMPSNHFILSLPSLTALNLSQNQGLFRWIHSSHQMAKVLELQCQQKSFQWIFRVDFLLGLTGLISLLSKGFSRVFSSMTVWKHQFFSAQPSL